MFDAGTTIGNFSEIVFAQLFLLLETKWAVIRGDDLQRVAGESLPKFFLMPFFAEWRRENIFRAFKSWRIHIFEGEVQILGASFRVGGQAPVACFANFLERLVAGEMNNVDGRSGHFRESNGAAGGFGFGGGGAGERVILRRALAFGQRLLNDDIDGTAILCMHTDQTGVFRGLAHGLEN